MIVSFTLERDAAGMLAVALHALGARNRRDGRVFPATLILLQAVAESDRGRRANAAHHF